MDQGNFVIEGVREDGSTFRPSDWTERLSSLLARFGPDHRLTWEHGVQPCIIDGRKCLVVARDLHERNPEAYAFLMHFAEENGLRIQPDRRQRDREVEQDRRGS